MHINFYNIRLFLTVLILFFFTNSYAAEEKILLSGSPWFQNCPKENEQAKKNCVIEQSIYIGEEIKARVVTINIEVVKGGHEAILRFMVPLETFLQAGIVFGISEKTQLKTSFIFCDASGCYAELKLDQEGLHSLMITKNFIITYYHLRSNDKDKEVKLNIDSNDLKFKLEDLINKAHTASPG